MQRTPFQRYISHAVRITDVKNGVLDATDKELKTIYGPVRKVMLVATIVDMEPFTPEDASKKERCRFVMDDGTSRISATWFAPGTVTGAFEIGDIVVLTARPSEFDNKITLIINEMRKITTMNEELFHRAGIAVKMKKILEAGKPLQLEDGGTIINLRDRAGAVFSEQGMFDEELDELEEPLEFDDMEEIEFQLKDQATPGSTAGGTSGGTGGSTTGDGTIPDGLDEGFMKEMILQTLFELDSDEGVTLETLKDTLGYEISILKKMLKQMVHEDIVEKIPGQREAYRPK